MSKTVAKPAPKAAAKPLEYIKLGAGDPAPWFTQRSCSNPSYRFDTAAGRYMVLGFFVTSSDKAGADALTVLSKNRALFDEEKIAFFGVTIDPADEKKFKTELPGIRWFWDADLTVSKLYGSVPRNFEKKSGQVRARRLWMVLDPHMRILKVIDMDGNGNHKAELVSFLKSLPPVEKSSGLVLQAPILFLPNVFEPELCQRLIAAYEKEGGRETGFMRDVDGKTVEIIDHDRKRRKDLTLTDEKMLGELRARINRRIVPEIKKAFFFDVTRIERFIVSCYESKNQGFFRQHRDNTTKGTAHRRFAVTLNLNDSFEGGELSFPEYGPRSFKPPAGGAVVFSCALLHAAGPVTKGTRYAFLPFLYDEAAAKIRQENQHYLVDKSAGDKAY